MVGMPKGLNGKSVLLWWTFRIGMEAAAGDGHFNVNMLCFNFHLELGLRLILLAITCTPRFRLIKSSVVCLSLCTFPLFFVFLSIL